MTQLEVFGLIALCLIGVSILLAIAFEVVE